MKKAILSAIIGLILSTNSMAWTLFGSSAPSCEDDDVRELLIDGERKSFKDAEKMMISMLDSLIDDYKNQLALNFFLTKTQKEKMVEERRSLFVEQDIVGTTLDTLFNQFFGDGFSRHETPGRMVIATTRTESKDDKLSTTECDVKFLDPVTDLTWSSMYDVWKSDGKTYVQSQDDIK
jgi:hypothetical protein